MKKADIAIAYFEKQNFDAFLRTLESIPPRGMYVVADRLFSDGRFDYEEDFIEKLSLDQKKKWKWLGSSERERDYLMKKPKEEFSEQDMFDLRTCDF